MKVKLLVDHTIGATAYKAGEMVEVEKRTCDKLVLNGFAVELGAVVVSAPEASGGHAMVGQAPAFQSVPNGGKRGLSRR